MNADTNIESSKEQPVSSFEAGERSAMQEALKDVLSDWSAVSNKGNQAKETLLPLKANLPQIDLNMDETAQGGSPSDTPLISENTGDKSTAQDTPKERIRTMEDLDKWIFEQNGPINQKELVDRIIELHQEKELEWEALREGGNNDTANREEKYYAQFYASFVGRQNRINDNDQIQRLRSRIPHLAIYV